MKRKISAGLVLFIWLSYSSVYAAISLDDFLPEFAGRGNVMGGADVCGLEGKDVFYRQTLRLIRETRLGAAMQQQLVKAFNIERNDGVAFYQQTKNADTCDAIKDQIQPMTEDDIKMWKMMHQIK